MAGIFVPIVIGIALLAMVVWLICGATFEFAMTIAVSVLVVSCPCALGLATPTAIMVGTGRGASNGILIKSAESLEMLGKAQTVVLDKTGTVTEGRPRVTDIISIGITEEELLQVAASVEKPSEHPLSVAIGQAAEERELALSPVTDFTAVPGGICANLDGAAIYAGNLDYMTRCGIDTS